MQPHSHTIKMAVAYCIWMAVWVIPSGLSALIRLWICGEIFSCRFFPLWCVVLTYLGRYARLLSEPLLPITPTIAAILSGNRVALSAVAIPTEQVLKAARQEDSDLDITLMTIGQWWPTRPR